MSERDPSYLDYIRSFRCLACEGYGADPHHQPRAGHGSMGMKVSDYRCVPLCRLCHDIYHRESWAMYRRLGIDVEAVICELVAGYFFAQPVAYVKKAI